MTNTHQTLYTCDHCGVTYSTNKSPADVEMIELSDGSCLSCVDLAI